MSQGLISTLPELLKEFIVEIPIVQRDYAQGRMDKHSKNVRRKLLDDIKSAILNKENLDLNFVYGKAVNDKFIPIDGQQRLTTLFLLYLYAFRNDETQTPLLEKFTYETRTTSRKFLKRLISHRADIFNCSDESQQKPSEKIEDSEWFVTSWLHDPTIKSVSVMLDDIVETFKNMDNFTENLLDSSCNLITFKFLEMQDLGMEDSLYIKLNARGKPLTDFENFKAQLIGRIKNLNIPYATNYEKRFDGEWTDFFWEKINNKREFDGTYYAFFGVLLMNAGTISNDNEWASSLDYSKIDKNIFDSSFYLLELMLKQTDKEINDLIFESLTERRTYTQRVLFHAVSVYLLKSKGVYSPSLKDWLRVIKNLAANTEIDNNTRYRGSIDGINEIAEHWDSILSYLAKGNKIGGFNQEQLKEEQIKAKIIGESPSFAADLYQAEKHQYFGGQIRSALYLSETQEKTYSQQKFKEYWSIISNLFDKDKPKNGNLLRRALLTLGDYTLPVSKFKTLCVDDPNETHKTPSLKSLFSKCGETTTKLLEALVGVQKIDEELQKIIDSSKVAETDWRYCFIQYPKLFDYKECMSRNHLRLREINGEMHMIPNKGANGYNYNLFLITLVLELQSRKIRWEFDDGLGISVEHYLLAKEDNQSESRFRYEIRHRAGQFTFITGEKNTEYCRNSIKGVADFIATN